MADVVIRVSEQGPTGNAVDKAADDIERLGEEAKKAKPKFFEFSITMDKTGRSANKMGEQLDKNKRDAEQLRNKLLELKAVTVSLGQSFAASGGKDMGIFKEFQKANAELNKVRRVAKSLDIIDPTIIKKKAEDEASTFAQFFEGGLLKALKTPQGAGIAGALAIFLGAAIGGAALAAAGGGAAAAAVAAAYQRDSVAITGAIDKQTDTFLNKWSIAGSKALDPTLKAIDLIGDGINRIDIDKIVGKGSEYLEDLARGVGSAITYVGTGIADFIDDAKPAVEVLAQQIPEMGRAVKEAFNLIGGGAEGGAKALRDLFLLLDAGILTIAGFVRGAEEIYGALSDAGDGIQEFMVKYHPFAGAMNDFVGGQGESFARTLGDMGHGARHSSEDFEELSSQMYNTADAADELDQKFRDLFDVMMTQDEANLRVKEGWIKLNKELRDGKRTLDESTQAGVDNVGGILDQIKALDGKREADIAAGNGTKEATETANRAYAGQVESLRLLLIQLGFNRQAVDDLIAKYSEIPAEINTNVNTYYNDYYSRQGAGGSAFDAGDRLARRGIDKRSGGVIGAAAYGGVHSGLTKVGEEGWEFARLPTGTMMYPHANSVQMESMAANAGGAGASVNVALVSSGGGDALVEILNTLIQRRRLRLKVVNGQVVPA